MLTYDECAPLLDTARNRSNGKPLQNNTRLFDRGTHYAIRFHYTDVVEIHPDGMYVLNSGGWKTKTTLARITEYAPSRVSQRNGEWHVYPFGWDGARFAFTEGMKVDILGLPTREFCIPV